MTHSISRQNTHLTSIRRLLEMFSTEPQRKMNRIAAAIGILLLTGCVTARATMLGTIPQQASVPAEQVRIYLADETLPAACERYALISLTGDVQMTTQAQLIAAARTRAGKIGANAVQLAPIEEPSTARVVAAAILGGSAERRGDLVAYRCQ